MGTFDVDFADVHGLWSLLTLIKQLEETVDDTIMTTGSEAYHAALALDQLKRGGLEKRQRERRAAAETGGSGAGKRL
jgi:hypothetical protein